MIKDFTDRFGVISGLSDHTMGSIVPIVATSLGAKIIEKHFILDRSIGGPDSSFSMNEQEFTDMVKLIREAEMSIGHITYELTPKQIDARQFCRSLYVVKDIKKGTIITEDNVRSIRPGFGLHPRYYSEILGKTLKKDLQKGDRMSLKFIK